METQEIYQILQDLNKLAKWDEICSLFLIFSEIVSPNIQIEKIGEILETLQEITKKEYISSQVHYWAISSLEKFIHQNLLTQISQSFPDLDIENILYHTHKFCIFFSNKY
ncbi:hypothetical protein M0811_04651 [Anaeramoeba ignava]|uniref:Uncharacterized protein n=1 Tax=Anaeramoeba ignava TaxID=1746090 RepID=A0A9Q0RGN1_ANAIG|nr:hypothetical protein M0811_04651 [Anaeramoeba ignava]